MEKNYYVYILTNDEATTFYIGATSDLSKIILDNKNKAKEGSSLKNSLTKLVYFEKVNSSFIALGREKQIKKWRKQWKIDLIKEHNPKFKDLGQKWKEPKSHSI